MSKHKLQTTFMNIGASSLLVIFIVLCIAIFATLSLSSARSDFSFSESMAKSRTAYYEASNASEMILDEIDALLEQSYLASAGEQDYYAKAAAALMQHDFGISVAVDETGSVPTISWQVPIDDTQILTVSIQLRYNQGEGGFYTINNWQKVIK